MKLTRYIISLLPLAHIWIGNTEKSMICSHVFPKKQSGVTMDNPNVLSWKIQILLVILSAFLKSK